MKLGANSELVSGPFPGQSCWMGSFFFFFFKKYSLLGGGWLVGGGGFFCFVLSVCYCGIFGILLSKFPEM